MIKHRLIGSLVTALLLAACVRSSTFPSNPLALPTFTPRPTERPLPTLAPAITAMTFTPTSSQPATAIPNSSATPRPTSTPTRRATRPPATVGPTATSGGSWSTGVGGGAHGVTGSLSLNAQTDTFTAGSRVVYTMVLNNTTFVPVKYGILGVGAYPLEGGSAVFSVAWDAAVTPNGFLELRPGKFIWSTYITPKVPGKYAVHVGMCFSIYSDCGGSTSDWESVSPDIIIYVK